MKDAMIKGIFMGKEFAYDGEIESIGEYLSAKTKGYKIWMGKTEYGFIYASYNGDTEPLVLNAFSDIDMFRFLSGEKPIENENITWSKSIPLPESCKGGIALRAQQLKDGAQQSGRKIEYNSEYVKRMVESL